MSGYFNKPSPYAYRSNPARLLAPVFCIIFFRCVSTVRKLMCRAAAISSLVYSRASSSRISVSLCVRATRFSAGPRPVTMTD